MSNSPEIETYSNNGHEKFSKNLFPGQIDVDVPGFVAGDTVSDGIKKGKIGGLISKLHEEEKHIVALASPGKIILYIGASAGLVGAVAGGVYLRSRRKHG